MSEHKYSKWTVEGDKKTKWICGCFLTADNYFKFCDTHNETLKKANIEQVIMTVKKKLHDSIFLVRYSAVRF